MSENKAENATIIAVCAIGAAIGFLYAGLGGAVVGAIGGFVAAGILYFVILFIFEYLYFRDYWSTGSYYLYDTLTLGCW